MLDSIGSFIGKVQPGSWPDWIAAIGTTAAFLVAAFAYSRDVKTRRWAQARLVHIELRALSFHGPNELMPALSQGATVGFGDVSGEPFIRQSDGVALVLLHEPSGLVIAAIHNGSSELLGPAYLRAYGRAGPGVPWGFEVPVGQVEPGSEAVAQLRCSNPHYPNGQPGVELEVTFRDSAGRWWRRRGFEPVRRARDRERSVRRASRSAKYQKARTRWGSLRGRLPRRVREAGRMLQARWEAGRR